MNRQAYDLEEEKTLPGVLMAADPKIFQLLYRLAGSEDSAVLAGIRRLLHLIPTDSEVDTRIRKLSVLWIRIRSNPHHLADSGSVS